MNKEEVCFMSACDMKDAILRQEITSQEITEILIERIEKINPIINAYCTPTFDMAREMAKKADDAVKNGDVDKACKMSEEHLERAIEVVKEISKETSKKKVYTV